MILLLPYPPTINHYYGVRGKARFIKPAGLEFRRLVAEKVAQKYHSMILGKVTIQIQVCPPDKRKRDIDNVLKALLDSLTKAGVWKDDSQIVDLRIVKYDPLEGGGTVVNIIDMEQDESAIT